MSTIRHPFGFGDRVIIDGDDNLIAVVVGFLYRPGEELQVELQWWANGILQTSFIPAWRLADAKR